MEFQEVKSLIQGHTAGIIIIFVTITVTTILIITICELLCTMRSPLMDRETEAQRE